MKIAENINMNSVYSGLNTVRGYMPSADTVKNWAIEPINSTWTKPTSKVVFLAIGVLATLAIGIKLISLMKNKSENSNSNLHEQCLRLLSTYNFEQLNQSRKNCESLKAELSPDQQIMLSAIKDVAEVKRKVELSTISNIVYNNVMDCITYNLGDIKTIPHVGQDEFQQKIKNYPAMNLATCVDNFNTLKTKCGDSGFENEKTFLKNQMNELQKIIKEKYQALSQPIIPAA